MRHLLLLLSLLLTTQFSATACHSETDEILPGPTVTVPTDVPSAPKGRLEIPRLEAGILLLSHSADYQGRTVATYHVGYDTLRHHSRWVAFRFDATSRLKNVRRSSEPFIDDPLLPADYHIGSNGFGSYYLDLQGHRHEAKELQPYYGYAFDRGHLCASADRYLSTEANEQTFYMTNMSPQLSAFNQRYWTAYEQFVQNLGRDSLFADTLYVVKGGTIRDDQIIGRIRRSNGLLVPVPSYYFMALLFCREGHYGALGFWMQHRDYGVKGAEEVTADDLAAHVVSIDELELLTGLDFFPQLPDDVEKRVEVSCILGEWGLAPGSTLRTVKKKK